MIAIIFVHGNTTLTETVDCATALDICGCKVVLEPSGHLIMGGLEAKGCIFSAYLLPEETQERRELVRGSLGGHITLGAGVMLRVQFPFALGGGYLQVTREGESKGERYDLSPRAVNLR